MTEEKAPYAHIRIEKLDGTVEEFDTDPYEKVILPAGANGREQDQVMWMPRHGIGAIGYSFKYDSGRHMIIHPNSVYRLIITEVNP